MGRKIIINAIDAEEVRIAVINERGILEDLDIETRGTEKIKGNIYKAIVTAVEPALNAAFVDYGADKEGFLTAHDVDPKYAKGEGTRINDLLKPKQEILVQVEQEEIGQKGAVLNTYLSLAGRYAVVMPGEDRHGVSRRIDDDDSRRRMKEAASRLEVPPGMGVIIRTAGKDRTKTELNRDLKVLLRLWENIQAQAARLKAPALIFKEQDVVIRALRDYFSAGVDEIVVDFDEAYDRAAEYMRLVMPRQRYVLSRYVERRPIFHHYKIEEQIEKLYSSRVPLAAGGSLVIEPTEALVSIDVNSGKQKGARQEETAFETNLDAAREVARQLRLRNLGGIIVVDFIDMASRRHRSEVERVMKEALRGDRARVKVGRISPNGTLELTRQRLGAAYHGTLFRTCATCSGTGETLNPSSHAIAILRRLQDRAARGDLRSARVRVEPSAANELKTVKWQHVQELERRYGVSIDIVSERSFIPGQDDISFEADPHAQVVSLPEPSFGPPEMPEGYEFEPEEDEEEEEEEEDEEEEEEEEEEEAEEDAADAEEDAEGEYNNERVADEHRAVERAARGPRGGRQRATPAAGRQRAAPEDGNSRAVAGGSELGLPTFELIDLAQYRARHPQEPHKERGGHDDADMAEGERPRRRKRRRRRGRGGQPGEISAQAALAASRPPPPAAAASPAKSGFKRFFKKLFGRED